MLSKKKIKLLFLGFSSFNGTLVRFSMEIDDSGFEFDKISLCGIAEAS